MRSTSTYVRATYAFCCSWGSEEEILLFLFYVNLINSIDCIPTVCREIAFLSMAQEENTVPKGLWAA